MPLSGSKRKCRREKNKMTSSVKRYSQAYLFIAPAIIILAILYFYNFFFGLYLSLVEWVYYKPNTMGTFVGLKNYMLLIDDEQYITAILNSIIWSFSTVLLPFIISIPFALLLNEELRGQRMFRALALLPWAVPVVVGGLIFRQLFHPQFGLINEVLVRLGLIKQPIMWFQETMLAFFVIILAQTWHNIPFYTITLLAGLQAVPITLHEAAKIDGASAIQRFIHITVPTIKPVALVALLQSVIWSFHNFNIVMAVTGGGPYHSTEVLSTFAYFYAFSAGNVGKGAAISTTSVLLLAIFGVIWIRYMLKAVRGE